MSFLSSQVKQSLVSKATSSLKCWSSMQFSPRSRILAHWHRKHFDDSRIKSLTFPKLVGVQLFLDLEQCFDHILTMLKWSVKSSVLDPFVNGPFHAHRRKCHHEHRICSTGPVYSLHRHSNGPAHEVAAFSDSTSSKHLGHPSSSPILQELGLAHEGMTPHPSANPKPGHSALPLEHLTWPLLVALPSLAGQRQSDWHS